VLVCADHSKWGVVGLARIADLSQVDVLVTDAGMPRAAQRALARSVGRLVVAGDGEPVA
jgi:DeoR/GlpR family transcriptional regulator of sugar metabolism